MLIHDETLILEMEHVILKITLKHYKYPSQIIILRSILSILERNNLSVNS